MITLVVSRGINPYYTKNMTYSISLELHEAVINDDKIILELVRNQVKREISMREKIASKWNNFFNLNS